MTDKKLNNACAVALGNFDGLHIGHKTVLKSTMEIAKKHNLEAKVMLFDIHPKEFLFSEKLPRLMTDAEIEKSLTAMGFGICRVSFKEIMNYSCEEFFEKILIEKLGAKAVCCGFNYSFGKNGTGNSETLKELCKESGIECNVSEPVSIDGMTVSSTAIRNFLLNGEVQKAAQMLGRNYAICGEVMDGDKRGRTMGFPTANQRIDDALAVPKFGVYETLVTVDGKKYKGVTNIGIRPTFLAEKALSETHIIDFSGDIYRKDITVELVRFLRPERQFGSLLKLKEQLEKDIQEVKGNV